jgi:hypothetical protein
MGYSIEEKIETISKAIWSGWYSTHKCLMKDENFNKLSLEAYSEVALEFIILYIHYCDREIYEAVETKERDIIEKGIVSDISKRLEKYDEIALNELLTKDLGGEKSVSFFYWSKVSYSNNFVNLYKERQLEYAFYKEIVPRKDESPKGTLLWEFGKKINTIVLGYPEDIVILMHSNIIAMEMLKILQASLLSTLEK